MKPINVVLITVLTVLVTVIVCKHQYNQTLFEKEHQIHELRADNDNLEGLHERYREKYYKETQ